MSECAKIRGKILQVLTHFPVLSPSMLQVGIGPGISPRVWRPELDKLVQEGKILRQEKGIEDLSGQYRTIIQIQLAPEPASEPGS
jgi:hypothetical protein